MSARPQPIALRISRMWGVQTVHLDLPPLRFPERGYGWAVSARGDPEAIEWQRFLADYACEVR